MNRRNGEGESISLANNAMLEDVNGDGVVTALDALKVINQISREPQAIQYDPIPIEGMNKDEEDGDRLLELLANDIAQIWSP